MLYWLFQTFQDDYLRYVRILKYISTRSGLAFIISLALTIFLGRKIIRILTALKVGQPIRSADIIHKLHDLQKHKEGTPTMGGVLIIGAITISTLICGRWDNPFLWLCLIVAIYLGILGFTDDYIKVAKKNSKGVSAKFKMTMQWLLAVGVSCFMLFYNKSDPAHYKPITSLFLPIIKTNILPEIGIFTIVFFIIFYSFIIIGTSNAVNLTDGLDGLAIGCTITTAGAFGIINYLTGRADFAKYLHLPYIPASGEVTVFCAALVGAGLGFLWFNCHPAKVFMGDTGSLSLGGILGTIAITCKQELLLPIIGFVFVMEAGSVIIQVFSFKVFGKRVFAMSPIHHHFELKGWHENKVIIRFWILSAICAVIGLAFLKG